jgi:hypothetical protein
LSRQNRWTRHFICLALSRALGGEGQHFLEEREAAVTLETLGWYASISLWLYFTGIGIPPCPEEAGILYAAGAALIYGLYRYYRYLRQRELKGAAPPVSVLRVPAPASDVPAPPAARNLESAERAGRS